MLRIVAAVALSLFVTLAMSDALCCPDGCTRDAQGDHHDVVRGDCVFCAAAMTPVAPAIIAAVSERVWPPSIECPDIADWRRESPVPPPRLFL
jgi:hypothetical protein